MSRKIRHLRQGPYMETQWICATQLRILKSQPHRSNQIVFRWYPGWPWILPVPGATTLVTLLQWLVANIFGHHDSLFHLLKKKVKCQIRVAWLVKITVWYTLVLEWIVHCLFSRSFERFRRPFCRKPCTNCKKFCGCRWPGYLNCVPPTNIVLVRLVR